jgi:hypothetical protein
MTQLTGKNAQMNAVNLTVQAIAKQIDEALPPGAVTPRHTGDGHFYGVPSGNVYPSVTGVISVIKDRSIQNFDMNEAMRYVEQNINDCVVDGKLDMMKTIDLLHNAKKASRNILKDAGDIGTQIPDRREEYFQRWIDDGSRPSISDYVKDDDDPRLKSGMRALDMFCNETEYIPIRTEVMVYSDRYKLAGMLDDIGMINTVKRKGDLKCAHDLYYDMLVTRCMKCDMKKAWEVCMMDLKSSNQFKDSYYYQVSIYYMMFENLTGIKTDRNFILKVSKDNGKYKTEELTKMRNLVAGAKKIIAAAAAVDKVKDLRKTSNAPNVLQI